MGKPAGCLADEFVSHLKYLELTRSRMEKLASAGAIVRRDTEQVYSGLFINAITSFEHVIEELFLGLLTGRINHDSRQVISRVTFKSNLVAREVVFGGRNYIDWFPYENQTEKRASAFFRNGLPFTALNRVEKTQIESLIYIRNVIVHQSSYSQNRFNEKVLAGLPLTPLERTPAGYLRSKIRISPIQTRYESLAIEMSLLARKLCT